METHSYERTLCCDAAAAAAAGVLVVEVVMVHQSFVNLLSVPVL